MKTAAQLVARFPWIPWREPIAVSRAGDLVPHYACRICIALYGLHADDIPTHSCDPADVRVHIAREHPV